MSVTLRETAIALWESLNLDLPPKRKAHAGRFIFGGLPLNTRARESLLRALVRAAIEGGYVPAAKDARYDPVELLAAGLDVVSRWPSSIDLLTAASDLAVRVSAFFALFSTSPVCAGREQWDIVVERVRGVLGTAIDEVLVVMRRTRVDIAARAKGPYRDALLAELVVFGLASDHRLGSEPSMRLARAMLRARTGDIPEALAIFEAILQDVPAHALARLQVTRCRDELAHLAATRIHAAHGDFM